jgi:hypothetical protein
MKFLPLFLTSTILEVAVESGALDASTRTQGEYILKANGAMLSNGRNDTCEDYDELISEASYSGLSAPAPKDYDEFASDMGVEQTIDANRARECLDCIEEAREYITNEVMVEDTYLTTRDLCKNKHKDCTFWSVLGECENNPAYMLVNCAPVCQSCEVSRLPFSFVEMP